MKPIFLFFRITILCMCTFLSLALFCLAANAQDSPPDRLKTIRVGWSSVPGLEDRLPDGTPGGYNYEYLAKLKQYTDWQYEFIPGSWAELEAKLINGEIDIVGDVAKSPERSGKYSYCDLPNGYSRMIMACRKDDNRFGYNDYASFNGITVATIPSSFRRALLNREAERHNFSITYKEYPTEEEMFQGLKRGDADVAIFSNVTRYSDYKVISEWEPNPFYFVVNKDRQDILSELNAAIRQLEATDIFIQQRLFSKYFIIGFEKQVAFSKKELNFIEEHNNIGILFNTKGFPISYLDEGQPRGVIVDYFQAIAAKTGLKFTYIYCASTQEMLQRFKNGEGDICSQLSDDFMYGEKLGASLTQPYIYLNYGLVTAAKDVKDVRSIALVSGRQFTASKLKNVFPSCTFMKYPDTLSCLNAVANHEVDAAVTHNMFFDSFSYHARYKNLHFHPLPPLDTGLSLGISNKANRALFSIIEKATSSLGTELESIDIKYSSLPHQHDFQDYFSYVEPYILIIIILLLGIGGLAFLSKQQKRFNRQLMAAKKQADSSKFEADKANEAKSAFLASMSHDMRTPLNGMLSFTAFASAEKDPIKIHDYLKRIDASGNLLLSLINDTLDLSRIESGKLALDIEEVPLEDLIPPIVTALAPTAELKDITLATDFPENAGSVWCDKLKCQKIALNLISNAIKYTPEGGCISISLKRRSSDEKGSTYCLTVEDNGIGMSDSFMEQMYEPFTQEKQSDASSVPGTGLGLCIVKKYVDLMGGTISVESHLKQGTRFTVSLPFRSRCATEVEDRQTGLISEFLRGKRVLLCDDNRMNIEIASILLKRQGVLVDVAENGRIALDKYTQSPPEYYDVILMDIRMPVMDGLTAAREIRNLRRKDARVPIIAMTADDYEENIRKAEEAGINGYVMKPINPQKLIKTLWRYMHIPVRE